MTRKLQLLRGTTVQNDAFTGSSGELTVDTDTHELRVHDGSTAGGHVIPTKSEVYTQTQADTILAGKANTSLSNLTSTGANIGNWSSNVTNCITEIPQDIKLELSNGTLTLKAGSKVYVPNGAGVFDEVVIQNDISKISGNNDIRLVFVVNGANAIDILPVDYCYSGSSAPSGSQYMLWYDTTNNLVKYTNNSGSTWTPQNSLPIAKITTGSGQITSIDQIFNGFGYIGSTVFALPGVKGLIPDGRNADGTLKSIEVTVNNVLTHTGSYNAQPQWIVLYSNSIHPWDSVYWIGYNSQENILFNKNNSSSATSGSKIAGCVCAFLSADGNQKITAFTPKTAFRAVDYSDYSNLVTTVNTKANDNAVVHLAGTETIGGYKYFSNQIRRDSVFGSSGTSLIEATDTNGKGFVVNQCFYANNAIVNRMAAYNATSQNWTYIDVWNYDNGGTYATAPASDGWGTILLTSAISKSQNGYVKLGNGIIIQWGHVDDPNNQQIYTVNLPTAFGSTNYKTMVITDHNTQSHSFLPNYINSAERTTTTFTVYRQGDARANSFEWIAIGY